MNKFQVVSFKRKYIIICFLFLFCLGSEWWQQEVHQTRELPIEDTEPLYHSSWHDGNSSALPAWISGSRYGSVTWLPWKLHIPPVWLTIFNCYSNLCYIIINTATLCSHKTISNEALASQVGSEYQEHNNFSFQSQ